MNTIGSRVLAHAERSPDDIFSAFLSAGHQDLITFAELVKQARGYARAYRERGVGRGEIILIILQHTPHLFYSFVGALLAGAIPSFMPFPSVKQRGDVYWNDHRSLFERLKPRLIVTYEENLKSAQTTIPNFSVDVIIAGEPVPSDIPSEWELEGNFDDVACLQHSSGTTGLKKGVMLTHEAILKQVRTYAASICLDESDRIASWLPLYHDMGFIACFMTALIEGIQLIALDAFEWVLRPQILLEAIETHGATLCWLPNFAFTHLVNATRASKSYDLRSIRAFINCSEPVKASTFVGFEERFGACGVTFEQLQVCYAMAENVFAVTQTDVSRRPTVLTIDADEYERGYARPAAALERSRKLLSCGLPLDGVVISVCDAAGEPIGEDRIGEIALSSPFLFAGYYLQQDFTDERLHDGVYKTRDLGFLHEGELYVTGRVDDMLIVNGRNYYAHEIEAIAAEVPGVIPGRSVALGLEDWRTDSTAVIVLAECRDDADRAAIEAYLREEIFAHLGLTIQKAVPLRPGQLVKTTSGKISRIKNRELFLQGSFAAARG